MEWLPAELAIRYRQAPWRLDGWLLRRIGLAAVEEVVRMNRPPAMTDGPGESEASRSSGQVGRSAQRGSEIVIFLVGATEMARLNRSHLGHVGATDVITFDYGPPELGRTNSTGLRGDIFICLDEARRQSRHFNCTWQEEVVRYLVHGLLHLRGYDDREPAARRAMKRQENRLLGHLAAAFPLSQLARSSKLSV